MAWNGPYSLRGPQGPPGIAGENYAEDHPPVPGPQGLQGPTGANGADGFNGATGPMGPTGGQGPVGPPGMPAELYAEDVMPIPGPVGATGATGAGGATGSPGATGGIGPMGPPGPATDGAQEDVLFVPDSPFAINQLTQADLAATDLIPYFTTAGNRAVKAAYLANILSAGIPGGRLTLTSGTPITTSDVTAATTMFYTPYTGNIITLYDGTRWQAVTFSEVTISLASVNNGTLYDVYGVLSGGALAIELLAWTNTTTRATGIVLSSLGRWVKGGDTTRLYLGTIYSPVTTTTEDSAANRYVWNQHNRVLRPMNKALSGSHTYNSATFRAWNASTANALSFVVGNAEEPVFSQINALVTSASTTGFYASFGLDSTTAEATGAYGRQVVTAGAYQPILSAYQAIPAAGKHTLTALESVDAPNTVTYAPDGNSILLGQIRA
jgi:hypothetical protein